MRVIETKVYKFEELSEAAQKKAIENNHDWNIHDEWYDGNYEDFLMICNCIGLDVDRKQIYFGLHCPGAGASFLGDYSYEVGAAKKLRDHAPIDEELHRIVDGLAAVQRPNFYRLRAKITSGHLSNHYSHENTVDIEVYDAEDQYRDIGEAEEDIKSLLKSLMRWLHKGLDETYWALCEDEAVKESLIANEVEFDENGGSI